MGLAYRCAEIEDLQKARLRKNLKQSGKKSSGKLTAFFKGLFGGGMPVRDGWFERERF